MSQDVRRINFLPGNCYLSTWPLQFQLSLWTSLILRGCMPVNACSTVPCLCLRHCTEILQPRLGVGNCISGNLLGEAVASEGVVWTGQQQGRRTEKRNIFFWLQREEGWEGLCRRLWISGRKVEEKDRNCWEIDLQQVTQPLPASESTSEKSE